MGVSSESIVSREEADAVPCAVEEFERIQAPTDDVFLRRYLRSSRPVVLTELLADWLPAEEWTPAWMAKRYGATPVVAAELLNGTLKEEATEGVVFQHVLLSQFVDTLNRPGPASHYVMAPTWNFPSTLQQDYRVPRYCAGAAYMRAKVWLGKAHTVTPLHRDVPHNLHVHLTGRKRWLLFPPSESSRLYPRGLFSGMPNFSHVDPEEPDYDRYPRFRGVTGFGGILNPGETLFIPHGWWHHTRSLDNAVSMNFWWGGRLIYSAALASTVFKRVRRIRRNEWG